MRGYAVLGMTGVTMAIASTAYTGIIFPEDPHMPGPQKAMLDATPDCIKNLFSVASGLVVIAAKAARLANAPDTLATLLREKLSALARAPDAVFVHRDEEHDVGSTDLEALVRSVLKPYGDHSVPIGEPVRVHSEVATTLALFLDELAMNAMKYGALTMSGGTVTLRWSANEGVLALAWIECGGPRIVAPPIRSGFGSQMLDRIVRSSGGRIDRDWRADGLVAELYLPLSEND